MVPINTPHSNALSSANPSTRFQATMAAGTYPDPELVEVLVERCAVEPDFFVRDMLTWALTRLPAQVTVPRLVEQLRSERAQARSQALHTLSKIGDGSAWPAITRSLLRDADDEVARAAWRTAVVLAPEAERPALAEELVSQLGRGDRTVRLSLSRALVGLGDVIEPALQAGLASADPVVREHAEATQRLLHDPDTGFDLAVSEAKRIDALGPERARELAC